MARKSLRQAAVFDLDRTLIPGTSIRIFRRHLAAAGLLTHRGGPVFETVRRAFGLAGDTTLVAPVDRLGSQSAKGWSTAAVRRVAKAAAPEVRDQLLPYGRELIASHRAAGRVTVLATGAPRPLIEPFAEALGFDHLLATDWAVQGKVFDGRTEGPLMWGRAKAAAVRALAADRHLDLAASYAYSGSCFDAALLESVGHPVAVNPDVRLSALAIVRRWEIRHLDKPPGVLNIAGRELQELVRPFIRREFVPNARIEFHGLEHIPAEGGAIIVANHRSYFDPVVLSVLLARAGRTARFLGKKEIFDQPIVGTLAAAVGGIPVDRGSHSDEPLEAAITALKSGDIVVLMPQGSIPRGRAFFRSELHGRPGAARMAQAARVPVIPVGLWGTEQVWPRGARLPGFTLVDPPLVTATVGVAVELPLRSAEADTRRIMSAIRSLLPDQARIERNPTPDELARTFPHGYNREAVAEVAGRRSFDN